MCVCGFIGDKAAEVEILVVDELGGVSEMTKQLKGGLEHTPATVIPPPVSGCRMLNASPSSTAPGVRLGAAGQGLT